MTEYKFVRKDFYIPRSEDKSSDTRVEKFKPCTVSK
jgi:hypothetical protein